MSAECCVHFADAMQTFRHSFAFESRSVQLSDADLLIRSFDFLFYKVLLRPCIWVPTLYHPLYEPLFANYRYAVGRSKVVNSFD